MALTEQEMLTIMTMLRAMRETMKECIGDIKGQIQRIRMEREQDYIGSISTGMQLDKEQVCFLEECLEDCGQLISKGTQSEIEEQVCLFEKRGFSFLTKELEDEIANIKKVDDYKELFQGIQLEFEEHKACHFEERGFSFLTKELEDEIANIKKVDDYKELFRGYIGFIFKGVQLEIKEKACPFERGFSLPEIRMRMDGGIVKRGMG